MKPTVETVLGKFRTPVRMTLKRKSGVGVGRRRDVTRSMSSTELQYIRKRARQARRGAEHREWILMLPAPLIAKRIR